MNIDEINPDMCVTLTHPKWNKSYKGIVINKTEHAVLVKLDNGDLAKVHPSVVYFDSLIVDPD